MDRDRNYYGGGGGGHNRYHRGGRRNYRGGGRGRGHRHQPYRSRGGGGGGRGGRSNRFGQQQQLDPETMMMRQIASFVSRVGEFQNLRQPTEEETQLLASVTSEPLRSVEFTTAFNINDLLPILCAPDKLEMLMKYSPDAPKVEDKVGKLVHLLISCTASLPMQTPCYAALTLAVHEHVKDHPNCAGFATRCLQYAMLQIAKELDTSLLTASKTLARSTCRTKLILRYLCILSHMGLIPAYEGESAVDPNRMTMLGFLSVLVDAATAAVEQFNSPYAGYWLALVVLSTLPYVTELNGVPQDVLEEKVRKPLERVMSTYKSTFTPGTGTTALLLKEPQVEDGDDDDDEEEEDEEEDEDAGSGQICDSVQDLLRATKYWRKEGQPSRFALPMDAPWKALITKSTPNPDAGEAPETRPVTYSGEPLYLSFPKPCELLNLLLGGAGSDSPMKLQCYGLEGAIFGRLPIFGSPPDPEDEDEDDDEGMEDGTAKNEHLKAFQDMSLLDRYFVAETLRDCLLSHESQVNPTGLQMGSAKTAAEELLRVCHVFSTNAGEEPSTGMEYAILETIFALLAQSNEYSSLRHTYLSRVLLELTRLEPSRLSQAMALAMTNLFQDYLPALVPGARDNFSRWFAFHLVHTDYQWPSAFWQHWEPYATSDKDSSRGTFVRRALNLMAENLCDPSPIAKQCFQNTAPTLAGELLGRSLVTNEESTVRELEAEIERRIWDNQEDPSLVLEFFKDEQVTSALSGSSAWARTDVLIRVMMNPAGELYGDIQKALEKSKGDAEGGEDDMEEDSAFSKDVSAVIDECIGRYKDTIRGVMEQDAAALNIADGDQVSLMSKGEAFLLRRVEGAASFHSGLLDAIVACLVKCRVVTSLGVSKWVLRDVGDSVLAPIMPGWSRLSIVAIRESLQLLAADSAGVGAITIDGGDASSGNELARKTLSEITSIFQYSIQRVTTLLATTQQEDKKLKPTQVDLLEGTKTLVFHGKKLLVSLLTEHGCAGGQPMAFGEVEDQISKSDLVGPSLAAMCTGDEASSAVRLLKASLENF